MTKQILLTRWKIALVDNDDYDWLSEWTWAAYLNSGKWYACQSKKNYSRVTVPMHRVIMDAPKGMVVDHINGDGLDNRRANLRICTTAENMRNRGLPSNNTSGYKGVFIQKNGKSNAHIQLNRKLIHLGMFNNPVDAAHAYDEAAKRLFGEFANLNFPNET